MEELEFSSDNCALNLKVKPESKLDMKKKLAIKTKVFAAMK